MRVFLSAWLLIGLICLQGAPGWAGEMDRQPLAFLTPHGAEHVFNVEVARSEADQRRGLMGRRTLGGNEGMLFVKETPQIVGLWMKETLIPLDMLFVRPDLTLAAVHANARPQDLTIIRSPEPVIAVIEIPAGRAKELDLDPGTKVRAEALNPKPRLEH